MTKLLPLALNAFLIYLMVMPTQHGQIIVVMATGLVPYYNLSMLSWHDHEVNEALFGIEIFYFRASRAPHNQIYFNSVLV